MLKRIDTTINILKRAKKANAGLNLNYWQSSMIYSQSRTTYKTEKELHVCGYPACIGGYIAVSPEWENFGGERASNGAPIIRVRGYRFYGSYALELWFETATKDECLLVNKIANSGTHFPGITEEFYGHKINDITLDVAIDRLEKLLKDGETE